MTLAGREERVSVQPRDFPTNRGGLCQKGWTSSELLVHPDRLLSPLIRDRKGSALRPASWEEALDHIAANMRGAAAVWLERGRPLRRGRTDDEKVYLLGKFARVALRTSQIDYNGRFCMASAAAASIKALESTADFPSLSPTFHMPIPS